MVVHLSMQLAISRKRSVWLILVQKTDLLDAIMHALCAERFLPWHKLPEGDEVEEGRLFPPVTMECFDQSEIRINQALWE